MKGKLFWTFPFPIILCWSTVWYSKKVFKKSLKKLFKFLQPVKCQNCLPYRKYKSSLKIISAKFKQHNVLEDFTCVFCNISLVWTSKLLILWNHFWMWFPPRSFSEKPHFKCQMSFFIFFYCLEMIISSKL